MSLFEQLRRRALEIPNLSQLSPEDIQDLKNCLPGLPEDYLLFLEQIGYGCLDGLQVYSGPIAPDEIYPKFRGDPANVILFGDDTQGYCFGFDTSQAFALVEVDPKGTPHTLEEGSFLSLMAVYLLVET